MSPFETRSTWDDIDGPRLQVAGRGIAWGAKPRDPSVPENPLAGTVVRSVDEARAAVREHVDRGVDWIKLYPTGGYSFTATGEAQYVLMYPLPVLQALVDEAHRLGRKTACHSFWRRGAPVRHHSGLRHRRTRIRADPAAARHRWCRKASSSIPRSSATPSRTWTTTMPRTPAASTE